MIKAFALGAAVTVSLTGGGVQSAAAQDSATSVVAVAGTPTLNVARYDLAEVGYQISEAFVSANATSYAMHAPPSADGVWDANPAATAPFKTRVVILRPSNLAKFNGTVFVEWMNVTAGQDLPADWLVAHREMTRKGYAWVGVSAQKIGIEGGNAIMKGGTPLKKANPQRYGTLSHPGDAFSYDIFTQVGRILKSPNSGGLLGDMVPKRLIGIGESQSAVFLTTYVNAVDRLARVYDGFFVHSRFGGSAALDGLSATNEPGGVPAHVRFRRDLRVPVLSLITETDLLGSRMAGYLGARRPDDKTLRVWEVAGTAHADNYMFVGAFIDSGKQGSEVLAKVFQPTKQGPAGPEAVAVNPGMPHHYVSNAALSALDSWVRFGGAPASTSPIVIEDEGGAPNAARDEFGIARGGVRTPWTDVPTVRLSGRGDSASFIGMLAGSGQPLTKVELARLYPGGKAEYLQRFTRALDRAIQAGHVLRDDRKEIVEIAAINFEGAP